MATWVLDRRGTASVETVVMLPVLVALLLGVFFLHRTATTAQRAAAAARECVWQYALGGCRRDSVRCEGVALYDAGELQTSAGKDTGGAQHGEQSPPEMLSTGVSDAISQWPVLGPAVQAVFGRGSSALASRKARGFMTHDELLLQARIYVPCNPEADPWQDKIKGLLCDGAMSAGFDVCK